MNVKIYYNKQWIDITNDILLGQITLADRCDEAFGVGSFSFESTTITDIIPAYSRLTIDDTYYLCSSEITQNLITGTIIHNVEVLDATAILSRYIVGTKNFSINGEYKYDYTKVTILNTLMKQKYGVTISISGSVSLTKQEEYTFGAGSTYYDVLCGILKNYNKRIKVTSITDTNISCKLINLNGTTYMLNDKDVLNYTINQNVDDYCKRLEGEMTNVIDRTNLTILNDYTCRIEDVKLDYDNCKILLPTRIEKLDTFKITGSLAFVITSIKGKYFATYRTDYSNETGWSYDIPSGSYPLIDWLYDVAESLNVYYKETPLYEALTQMANYYNLDLEEDILLGYEFTLKSQNMFTDDNGEYDWYFNLEWLETNTNYISAYFDYSEWVIEKNKYDILETKEKPKYAYYKSGDNYIDGMNVAYKDSFWNNILGITEFPFFNQHTPELKSSFTNTESGITLRMTYYGIKDNPVLNKYYIKYYSITDPLIKVDKNEDMLDCSRSYSKGSNFIDFDKLINSMQIDNSYLGKPELAIELDVSNYTTLPQVTNKITFRNRTWYLSNYTITYSYDKTTMNLNFVSNYNKLADVIGVSTQYEETKNPMNNIIERPILIEAEDINVDANNLWLKFTFGANIVLFKRATLLESGGHRFIYCEMLDHYAFDKTTKKEKNNVYICEDVPYANILNEIDFVQIDIIEMPPLTFEQSMALPYYTGTYTTKLSIPRMYIYKDARERLLFTILLK